MVIRYAFAQFATKKDMPDAYLNVGIVAEADGRIGFQRIQRFDLLVRENPEYFAVYPEYIDAFKTEVDFFENALNAGQVSLDELQQYQGILTFSPDILTFSPDMQDTIEPDGIDYFMDFNYENAVRADLRAEPPIEESRKEDSPSLINTPAFRYFIANYGCKQHQRQENDPLACAGCQIDYLDLVDRIVSHMTPEQYTTVRELALLKRAAEAFQAKKTG